MQTTALTRTEMIDRLVAVQNCPGNEQVDILTITGFMTDDQVAAHLARYETAALKRALHLQARRTR